MAEGIEQKLIAYMRDAVAMERNVDTMLVSMIETTRDPRMQARIRQHQEETRAQIRRLEDRLEAHGESSSTMKDAAAKMGAAVKGVLDHARGDKAGRNLRDAYTAEHAEIAAYQLLERVAVKAGDMQTAEVARTNRGEEEDMARFLDGCWDMATEQSLAEEAVGA